jgi:hypothetical membrane protein
MRGIREVVAGGVLFFVAGTVILMGIITGEALYQGAYRTDENTISDLGGSRPPESVVLQPSASIFDTTMIVAGLMILVGAYLVQRGLRRPGVTVPAGLLGAGVLGVGLFPGNTDPHVLFALLTFIAGGVAAVCSYKIVSSPIRYVFVVLGSVALAALLLGLFLIEWGPVAELGEGGIERWVAYPVVLWLVGIGAYLAAAGGVAAPAADAAVAAAAASRAGPAG